MPSVRLRRRHQAGPRPRLGLNEAATIRIFDVRVALPGVRDQAIRRALETLKKDGLLVAEGTGRGATWRRTSAILDG